VEVPIKAVPPAVLQKHAGTMFSGSTGAVVASGEGALTKAPTYTLCKDVATRIAMGVCTHVCSLAST